MRMSRAPEAVPDALHAAPDGPKLLAFFLGEFHATLYTRIEIVLDRRVLRCMSIHDGP